MSINYNITDKFGQLLISTVRDRVVNEIANIINGKQKGYIVKELDGFSDAQKKDLLNLSSWAIIQTLSYFFFMLDDYESEVRLEFFDDESNMFIDLTEASDGLTGDMLSKYGWISRYSKIIIDEQFRY